MRRTGHRARPTGTAQDRARDLDRRDVAHHRRRARRRRQRPHARSRLRARRRADAARDGARQPSQRRPAARARRTRRARRLLPVMGGGRERRTSALRRAGDFLRRSLGPPARLRALGRRRSWKARLSRSPAAGALTEARALLASLGAVDGEGRITDEGRAIASLALPPRLARMVVDAARADDARAASEVAVVLTERGLGGDSVDLTSRLEAFRRDRSERADDARRLARALAARALTPTLSQRERGRYPSPFGRRVAVRTPAGLWAG